MEGGIRPSGLGRIGPNFLHVNKLVLSSFLSPAKGGAFWEFEMSKTLVFLLIRAKPLYFTVKKKV